MTTKIFAVASKRLPCSSPRSEHGILGKRRVKLRSPAARRTPRGCQPDKQFRPRLSGTLWSAAVRVRGSRAQRRGAVDDCTHSPRATEGAVSNGTHFNRPQRRKWEPQRTAPILAWGTW